MSFGLRRESRVMVFRHWSRGLSRGTRQYSSEYLLDNYVLVANGDPKGMLRTLVRELAKRLLEDMCKAELGFSYGELYDKKMRRMTDEHKRMAMLGPVVVTDPTMPRNRAVLQAPGGDRVWLDNVGPEDNSPTFSDFEKKREDESDW